MSSAPLNSIDIKAQAQRLGFVACGLAKAEPVAASFARRFLHWLEMDYCAGMDYMRRHVEMRLQPQLLVPGVKTIVSLAMNFMPQRHQPAISLYAQGKDYHDVLRERMQQLMADMHLEGRAFVDTAPVLERYWAWRSGIGTITQGGFISVPGYGPTVFLGELFLTAEADRYDQPLEGQGARGKGQENTNDSLVGTCRASAQSNPLAPCPSPLAPQGLCPALTPDGLNARRCISYHTIEHRGPLPDGLRLTATFYGCDRCLRATPQFAEATPTAETAFQPSEALLQMKPADWQALTVEQYRSLFKGSAVKRAKYDGLMRNIARWLEHKTAQDKV